jgi:DNA-binding NarL/FixJ family response regulator
MTGEAAQLGADGNGFPGQTENAPGLEGGSVHPDAAPGEARPQASPVKVLVVEDSPIVRERLVALIGGLGNVSIVGQAEDGFKAQQLFRQHRPDAVVLDIQVPGINGLDLLAQFKKEHHECVVMVLTTYAFEEFRRRCAALGADHFFDKSTEFERINEVLGAFPTRRESKPANLNCDTQ